jgi:hypothetical protein
VAVLKARPVVASAALWRSYQGNIGDFGRSNAWNYCGIDGKALEQRRCFVRCLILEAPGHRHRSVEDEGSPARPLSRDFRTERPRSFRPWLSRSSAAMATLAAVWSTAPAGTSRATARSCFVINTSSPPATRSSKAESVVFASKAPTVTNESPDQNSGQFMPASVFTATLLLTSPRHHLPARTFDSCNHGLAFGLKGRILRQR